MKNDLFRVRNNSGTIFRLKDKKITFSIGQEIDLCSQLNMTYGQIKNDPEIKRELAYNNLKLIDSYDSSAHLQKTDSSIDDLKDNIGLLLNKLNKSLNDKDDKFDIEKLEKILDSKLSKLKIKGGSSKSDDEDLSDDEEKLREDAIEKLLKRKGSFEKSFNEFGQERKREKDDDDFSDLIDF